MSKQSLTSLIVDDERAARNELENLLVDHCPAVSVVGKAENVSQARGLMKELSPDLMFLDVRMPGESGFDLVDESREQGIAIVFVTAYDEYAVEAFRKAALHYLIKPCTPADLIKAVERARLAKPEVTVSTQDQLKQAKASLEAGQRLIIAHRSGFKVMRMDDILFLESDGNYTRIQDIHGAEELGSRPIGYFERQLPESQFFRIHRSYVINLDHVEGYDSNKSSYVQLRGGKQLEISKRRLKAFLEKIMGAG